MSDSALSALSSSQRERAVLIAASVLTTDPWTPDCEVLPDMNTLTIVVTGASGYIGSHVARSLGCKGHRIVSEQDATATGRREREDG